jgi:hypothetical protein
MSLTKLLPYTIVHSLVSILFMTLLSISRQATLKFGVDSTNRLTYALEAVEMKPLT